MIFAFVGLVWIMVTVYFHRYPEVFIGFGFIGFDLTIELSNLKEQLYIVGKAIRDELKEKKK